LISISCFTPGSAFTDPGSVLIGVIESTGSFFIAPGSNLIELVSSGSLLIAVFSSLMEDGGTSIVFGNFGKFWLGNFVAKSAATCGQQKCSRYTK